MTHKVGADEKGEGGKPFVPGYTENKGMFYTNVADDGSFSTQTKKEKETAEKGGQTPAEKKKKAYKRAHLIQGQGILGAKEAAKKAAMDGTEPDAAFDTFMRLMFSDVELSGRDKGDIRRAFDAAYKAAAPEAAAEAEAVNEILSLGAFHRREKQLMQEERLLMESGKSKSDSGSQWGISRSQMIALSDVLLTQHYGELNLSAENIDKCADIYIDKMKDDMITVLKTTKGFATNVGKYFNAGRRDHAAGYAKKAIQDANTVADKLSENMDADPNTDK